MRSLHWIVSILCRLSVPLIRGSERFVKIVVVIGFAAACGDVTITDGHPPFLSKLPPDGKNNLWYAVNDSDTAIVFVHGILGNSRGTWLNADDKDPARYEYWPELLLRDNRVGKVSVFLGGFYTEPDSQDYDARDAALELLGGLTRLPPEGEGVQGKRVIDKPNLIFVAHSTGGIVIRYILYHHRDIFRDKNVGLLLIASPSYGSKSANTLDFVTELYNNKLGKQLEWSHPFLEELDKNFKDLVNDRSIPTLIGVEAVENHFVRHRRFWFSKWWPMKWQPSFTQIVLVEPLSAGRYFGGVVRLRDTDHFGTVKPRTMDHPAHQLLVDFMNNRYRPALMTGAGQRVVNLVREVLVTRGTYESIDDYGEVARSEVRRAAQRYAEELLSISDERLWLGAQIAKYEYAAYAYAMAAESSQERAIGLATSERAIDVGNNALELIKNAQALALTGDHVGKTAADWARDNFDRDRVLYVIAVAHAIRWRLGGASTPRDVRNALNSIDRKYLRDYPVQRNRSLSRVPRG
jgi:pimeloyl-ACP methyl ester carboxylesterase